MSEPTATDWAYLAGILDGEGSLVLHQKPDGRHFRNGRYTYYRSDNSFQCIVSISNTDFKMIDWIQYTFGGSTYCQRRKGGNRLPQFQLSWQAADSVSYILRGCMPYLLTKYEVAEAMLHFLDVPQWEKEVRHLLHKEFKDMKVQIKLDKGVKNNG